MKIKEREKARNIRIEQGLSIGKIASELGVSKSSVLKWVKDIQLTPEQNKKLKSRTYPDHSIQINLCRKKRQQYQEDGRKQMQQNDPELIFGCALFWAEGAKSRNQVNFCNTDKRMMLFFVNFLKKYFNVSPEQFALSINCYLNNGLILEQIQKYWLDLLNLPESSLRKCTLKSKYYDGKKSGKYPYGVCKIVVSKTEIVQQIYGAIKEMIGDESDSWLD